MASDGGSVERCEAKPGFERAHRHGAVRESHGQGDGSGRGCDGRSCFRAEKARQQSADLHGAERDAVPLGQGLEAAEPRIEPALQPMRFVEAELASGTQSEGALG